jgi:5-methylcytosine-specific restriction enzyme subunit McrC
MSKLVELMEYEPKRLPREAISNELARSIWQNHKPQVAVEPPSFRTDDQWELTSLGNVGYLPITRDFTLALRPKVPLRNLFGMLEYAHRQEIRFFEGLVDCGSLEEFYERLANVLAKRVIDRQHKGLHRKYIQRSERSGFVRGRIDLKDRIRRPWDVFTKCQFEEHTPQIEDNQILTATLRCIANGGVCSERVLPTLRRAYRGMSGIDETKHFTGKSCTGRLYDRLNSDYEALHALCRFFLDRAGPGHQTGEYSMLPFLIDMNELFEQFVAEWLLAHLPHKYSLQAQSRFVISGNYNLQFLIDLVLIDVASGKVVCVLDTKYKRRQTPATSDIEQVTAYAEAKGTDQAILVYPITMSDALDTKIGGIRVRSLTFSLDDNLEAAGSEFLGRLLGERFQ